jgi:hypothetical protein
MHVPLCLYSQKDKQETSQKFSRDAYSLLKVMRNGKKMYKVMVALLSPTSTRFANQSGLLDVSGDQVCFASRKYPFYRQDCLVR